MKKFKFSINYARLNLRIEKISTMLNKAKIEYFIRFLILVKLFIFYNFEIQFGCQQNLFVSYDK